MDQVTDLDARLRLWSVPSDVRDALRRAVNLVSADGVSVVADSTDDLITLAVRDQPAAVYLSPSRVSAALEPTDAERAHRADSAIGLDRDSEINWIVHCRYGRLDSSRLNAMSALVVKALRRFAPKPQARPVAKRTTRRRATGTSTSAEPGPTRRSVGAAGQEERRRTADAAIPRCSVPGCNLPMVGGSCGFHD